MRYLSSLKNKKLANKICLLRVDFNLMDNELSENNLRIQAVLPTIKFLISRGAKVVILSHRGRPKIKSKIKNQNEKLQFKIKNDLSLKPLVKILSSLLKKPVHFIDFLNFPTSDVGKLRNTVQNSAPGSIFLMENLRFLPGEDKNDKKLAKKLASIGTFYVDDAFAFSHRKDASMVSITKFIASYAGFCFENEIKNLSQAMRKPKKPLLIILGGAKISDKIGVIKNFLGRANKLLIAGAIANTFFAAKKIPIGDSLYEKDMLPLARQLLKSPKIVLPIDWLSEKGEIFDIGPETRLNYAEIIRNAGTIIWNGPVGYIENPEFKKGTEAVAEAILKSRAFSIVGGGETTSFLKAENYKLKANVFLSTGGGAMLEFLSGKKLPGVEALK